MSSTRNFRYLIGAVASLAGTVYSGSSILFYAWLNAADPERFPADKAAPWLYPVLAVTLLCLCALIFCVVMFVKKSRQERK